jgi:hypothetical protein
MYIVNIKAKIYVPDCENDCNYTFKQQVQCEHLNHSIPIRARAWLERKLPKGHTIMSFKAEPLEVLY